MLPACVLKNYEEKFPKKKKFSPVFLIAIYIWPFKVLSWNPVGTVAGSNCNNGAQSTDTVFGAIVFGYKVFIHN
jgi:hypothetical protein